MKIEERYFRHLDPALPPMDEAEKFELLFEMSHWTVAARIEWLFQAGDFLRERQKLG